MDALPKCIGKKIKDIRAEPVWNPPATVSKYSYKGQIVFLFSSNCCDQYNTLYDQSCNYICAPSGGFTGQGDGLCTDFDQVAKFIKVVFKDRRGSGK